LFNNIKFCHILFYLMLCCSVLWYYIKYLMFGGSNTLLMYSYLQFLKFTIFRTCTCIHSRYHTRAYTSHHTTDLSLLDHPQWFLLSTSFNTHFFNSQHSISFSLSYSTLIQLLSSPMVFFLSTAYPTTFYFLFLFNFIFLFFIT